MTTDIIHMQDWSSINERYWNQIIPEWLKPDDKNVQIIRVFPNTDRYQEVVKLRHRGFIRSGFLPTKHMDASVMKMERDRDNIVLGFLINDCLAGTVTINRVSEKFSGLPIEMEKLISIPNMGLAKSETVEFSKLVFERVHRDGLKLMGIACFLTWHFGKVMVYSAGLAHAGAIRRRLKFGFSIIPGTTFADIVYDGAVSQLFQLDLRSPHLGEQVCPALKSILRLFHQNTLENARQLAV